MGGGVHAKILAGGIVALGIATGCFEAVEETATMGVVPSADGVPIAYETAGEGPLALVFVHGWSCDRSYWSAQVEAFSPAFRVVAMDLAGHGESGGGREIQSMTAFGADVAAVVDHLGVERALLIGHSMGGDVIMEAARLLPGRVLGLVWVDTYRQLPIRRTPEELEAILAPFRADFAETTREAVRGLFPEDADSSLVERVAADMSSAPPSIAVGALEAALRYAYEIPAALRDLDVSVVAINAGHRPTDERSLRDHGVDVVIVEGPGHFLMMEDPAGFNRALGIVADRLVSTLDR